MGSRGRTHRPLQHLPCLSSLDLDSCSWPCFPSLDGGASGEKWRERKRQTRGNLECDSQRERDAKGGWGAEGAHSVSGGLFGSILCTLICLSTGKNRTECMIMCMS
jgi:hypothetical protein